MVTACGLAWVTHWLQSEVLRRCIQREFRRCFKNEIGDAKEECSGGAGDCTLDVRLTARAVLRAAQRDGGGHDIRIAPLGWHSSDRSANRDDRWSEYPFASSWRPDLQGEPIAPGSLARGTRACRRLAHPGARGVALRGRGQPLQRHEMVRAGLDPHRRDTGPVSLLPIRAVAPCHDPEWDHLSRLCRRSAAGRRRARLRRRSFQAPGTTILRTRRRTGSPAGTVNSAGAAYRSVYPTARNAPSPASSTIENAGVLLGD